MQIINPAEARRCSTQIVNVHDFFTISTGSVSLSLSVWHRTSLKVYVSEWCCHLCKLHQTAVNFLDFLNACDVFSRTKPCD